MGDEVKLAYGLKLTANCRPAAGVHPAAAPGEGISLTSEVNAEFEFRREGGRGTPSSKPGSTRRGVSAVGLREPSRTPIYVMRDGPSGRRAGGAR